MRKILVVILLMIGSIALTWVMPAVKEAKGIAGYLPLHTLLETVSICISVLVFAVGWNAYSKHLPGNIVILSSCFLGVGILDFSHTLSYAGMPEYLTPSGPEKAINFWLVARALAAGALLAVSILPWRPFSLLWPRYFLLSAVLVLSVLVHWILLAHQEWVPRTFIAGEGLTPFKIIAEYLLVAVNLVSAACLWFKMGRPQVFNVTGLFGAVCSMAVSELAFTLYADVTDIFNLLGHLFKSVSYLFIYRAIFVSAIETPYRLLSISQAHLQATLSALPDWVIEIDSQGRCYDHYAPRNELMQPHQIIPLGDTLRSTLPAGCLSQIMQALQKAQTDGYANGEFCWLEKGWFEYSLAPKISDMLNSDHFILILRNITARKQIENALRESENRFKAIFSQASVGLAQINSMTGQFLWANPRYAQIVGLSLNQLHNITFVEITHPDDLEADLANLERLNRGAIRSYRMEKRYIRPDGSCVWVELTVSPMWKVHEQPNFCITVVQDITARKQNEEKVRLTSRVFESTQEGIFITDSAQCMIEINQAYTDITGYPREEVIGTIPCILQNRDYAEGMWNALALEGHWSGETLSTRKNGEIYSERISITSVTDEYGKVIHYIGVFSDISVLKQHEKRLEQLAHYDALTGIPNRVLLTERLHQAMLYCQRDQKLMAVCYFDLDGFKPINDRYGHQTGDALLIRVAQLLEAELRTVDTVARLGGDEFVILITQIDTLQDCEACLERLVKVFTQPVMVDSQVFKLTASIGVALYPQDDDDPDILLRYADQAMYRAKQNGKNRFQFFDPDQNAIIRIRREQLHRIEQGLRQGEFILYYQPKVRLSDYKIVGAEALIRWQHPERGLLSPGEFLPLIENSQLEIEIGEWVIETALAQIEGWQRRGLDLEVSINISAQHLQSQYFIEHLRTSIERYPSLKPYRLQIEILETVALADMQTVTEVIELCHGLHVGFALDDFGTGYSSLAYLRRLPVDTLKIDQSFVRDMLTESEDCAIVQGIVALAKTFNRITVAEGVETEAHFKALREMGCDLGQGYGISPPIPPETIDDWIRIWTLKFPPKDLGRGKVYKF